MSKALDSLGVAFIQRHPEAAAAVFETVEPEAGARFLTTAPSRQAAVLLTLINPTVARSCVAKLSARQIGKLVNEMSDAAGAAILRPLAEDERVSAMQQLESVRRKALTRMLHFPQQAVGAMMDPYYPAFPADLVIGAIARRLQGGAVKDFTCVFTLDRTQCPVGVARTHDIFLSDSNQIVSSIAAPCNYRIHGTTDWRSVAANPDLRRWNALPVVDDENRYIGALREDAIMRLTGESGQVGAVTGGRRTSFALGEVFRLGLGGLLETIENSTEKRT